MHRVKSTNINHWYTSIIKENILVKTFCRCSPGRRIFTPLDTLVRTETMIRQSIAAYISHCNIIIWWHFITTIFIIKHN